MKQADLLRARGYWPAAEVAARCGLDPSTIYLWLREGKVEGLRVPDAPRGRHYVAVASVIAHLGEASAKALGFAPPEGDPRVP